MSLKQFVVVAYKHIDDIDFDSEADAIIDCVPVLFIDAVGFNGDAPEIIAALEAMTAKHNDRVLVIHRGAIRTLTDALASEVTAALAGRKRRVRKAANDESYCEMQK